MCLPRLKHLGGSFGNESVVVITFQIDTTLNCNFEWRCKKIGVCPDMAIESVMKAPPLFCLAEDCALMQTICHVSHMPKTRMQVCQMFTGIPKTESASSGI